MTIDELFNALHKLGDEYEALGSDQAFRKLAALTAYALQGGMIPSAAFWCAEGQAAALAEGLPESEKERGRAFCDELRKLGFVAPKSRAMQIAIGAMVARRERKEKHG